MPAENGDGSIEVLGSKLWLVTCIISPFFIVYQTLDDLV